jgi:acyl-CoA hydrolase/RimJ/RimL family protein N-acetyltransferase
MTQTPDWQRGYASKLATPEEAIRCIPRGRTILIASGAAEPVSLVEGLVRYGDHLADNHVVHLLTLGPAPYVAPGLEHFFRHIAFFIGPNVRDAVQQGRADFLPVFLSEIPELIRSHRIRIDVALIQVSPPDQHGYASLGVSVDVVRAAVDTADLVLAEVNPRMPRTHGDSFVHARRIHCMVPVDRPLLELSHDPPGEVEREIGRYVATLIPDGATLQAGIGKIPEAVLAALTERKDLGVHTEMFSDGFMRLAEAGAVTGLAKTYSPGKMVTSFVMGSRRLYEWVDDHPGLELRPSDVTNDPGVIARNDRMVSVNSALAVDLTGQVASDTLMGQFFSGIGGQVDFVRGAAKSRGGKAVIVFRSTAKEGSMSRILPVLDEGAGVVTSRGDVRYVVTEYGVADLWGKTIRERARALIDVAHPQFRAELLVAAKRRHYVFPDQIIPRGKYPWKEASLEKLRDGREIVVRPVRITDEEALQRLFYVLSDESTYKRFMHYKRAHPHEEMQELVDLDYEQSMAMVACLPDDGSIVGVSRYDVDPATRLAEIAFVVQDDWQCRGIGTLLLRRMADIARDRGLAGFQATVLASNTPMLMVFHRSGLKIESTFEGGVYELKAYFALAGRGRNERGRSPSTTTGSTGTGVQDMLARDVKHIRQ